MRTLTLTLAALVAFGGTALAQSAERAPAGDLTVSLKAGDTHYYAFSWNLGLKIKIAPPPGMGPPDGSMMEVSAQNVNLVLTMTQKVTKVENGTASIEATITSVKCDFEVKSPMAGGSTSKYDSTSPDGADDVLKTLKVVVGKKLTMDVDQQGKVTNLKGADTLKEQISTAAQKAIQEKLQNAPPGGGGGGGLMGGMGQMGGAGAMQYVGIAFSDDSLGSLISSLTNIFPKAAKAKGETWTHPATQKLPPLGAIELKAKFTHAGDADGKTTITFAPEGEIKLVRGKPDPNDPGAAMQQKVFGKQKVQKSGYTGTSTVSKGLVLDSKIVETMETLGELDLPQGMGGGQIPQGMKVGLGITITLRYVKQTAAPVVKKKTQSDF